LIVQKEDITEYDAEWWRRRFPLRFGRPNVRPHLAFQHGKVARAPDNCRETESETGNLSA